MQDQPAAPVPALESARNLELDQAKINVVIGQRNNALNAVVEIEAHLVVTLRQRDELQKQLDDANEKLRQLTPKEPEDGNDHKPAGTD